MSEPGGGGAAGWVVDVPAAVSGVRLDRAVAMLADVTRAAAAALVDGGAVRVGGEVARDRSRRLREHDRLAIDEAALAALAVAPLPPAASHRVPFSVVYEDEDIVVVDKPAGVVVHPGAGNRLDTLVAGLLDRYPDLGRLPGEGAGAIERPGIVHRLDKETSGLLVVARSATAFSSLVSQLAARTMSRVYLAIAVGHLEAGSGVIDAPIGRAIADPTRMAVIASGREARTSYEVLRRFGTPIEAGELELSLETGRTHQIRVHLAAIGHPVLGDRRYGGRRGAFPVPRPMLHAARLSLEHPRTGERMRFESALPEDFLAALGALS